MFTIKNLISIKISLVFLNLLMVSKILSEENDVYKQLNLFGEVYERVRSEYVEKVKDKDLIEAAINGMLQSLDPHSSYLTAESFNEMKIQTKGEFGGLGIEVTMEIWAEALRHRDVDVAVAHTAEIHVFPRGGPKLFLVVDR